MCLRSQVTSGNAENTTMARQNSITSKLPGTGRLNTNRPVTSTTVSTIMKASTAATIQPSDRRTSRADRAPSPVMARRPAYLCAVRDCSTK